MVPVWLDAVAWAILALFVALSAYVAWLVVADWVNERRTIRAVRRHMRERREQTTRDAYQRELDGLASAADAAMDRARDTVDREGSR